LKLVKRLLETGISLQQIRIAVDQLRAEGIEDLAGTTLMSDGASVYLCTSSDEVIDLVNRGQGVFGIAVGAVLREVETTLITIDAVRASDVVDDLAAKRASRAS
jgi:DNA-binding transcriptional MerR regulator